MFAVKLKELCDQILPGRVKLQEFPAAQLYNVGDGIKAVQSGAIEIAAADTSAFAPQLGNVDVNRIPGLAKSPAHVFDFWTQYSDEFSKRYLVDKYGMGVKMLYPTDSVVWWFKKPYTSLADIKGRKMGTSPGELLRVLSEGMGMNPAPIDLAERLTAIQTGVVEGSCGTSYTTGYSYSFHKYAPYVYPPSLSPFYGAQLLFYNYKWLNTLPADIKDQFVNVILPRALLEGSYKTQIGYAGKILDLLQKDGGIITDFNKADHDKVLNEIYPACAKILMKLVNQWEVDAIVKVGEKYERGLNWDIKP